MNIELNMQTFAYNHGSEYFNVILDLVWIQPCYKIYNLNFCDLLCVQGFETPIIGKHHIRHVVQLDMATMRKDVP